jgi:hypothetical protein
MKPYELTSKQAGFLDLGLGIALLTVFGFTTTAVYTARSVESYQDSQCYEEYNLDQVCIDSHQ